MSVTPFTRTASNSEHLSFITINGIFSSYAYYLLVEKDQHKAASALRYLATSHQLPDYPAVVATSAPVSFWEPANSQDMLCQAANELSKGGAQLKEYSAGFVFQPPAEE